MTRRRALLLAGTMLLATLVASVALHGWTWRRPTAGRLAALRSERDSLETRLLERLAAAGEPSFGSAPRGEVVVGLPADLVGSLLARTVTSLFGETRIVLEDVHTRAQGEARANVLFSRRTVGAWRLDIAVRHLEGLLRPEAPQVRFAAGHLDFEAPLRIEGGRGEADLRLRWDSKGLAANVVCGDADVTRRVAGLVLPREYRLRGRFSIEATGDALVLRPQALTRSVRLFVAPSAELWETLDGIIDSQRKGCELALGKADVRGKLAELLARGFEVSLPDELLRPITIPVGATAPLDYDGSRYQARISPGAVVVAADRLWTAAGITIESSVTPSDAGR